MAKNIAQNRGKNFRTWIFESIMKKKKIPNKWRKTEIIDGERQKEYVREVRIVTWKKRQCKNHEKL